MKEYVKISLEEYTKLKEKQPVKIINIEHANTELLGTITKLTQEIKELKST